jgi:hypothetical protein
VVPRKQQQKRASHRVAGVLAIEIFDVLALQPAELLLHFPA